MLSESSRLSCSRLIIHFFAFDSFRRIQQLGEEIQRVNSNQTLSSIQKASLIKEKHAALMKPVGKLFLNQHLVFNKKHIDDISS